MYSPVFCILFFFFLAMNFDLFAQALDGDDDEPKNPSEADAEEEAVDDEELEAKDGDDEIDPADAE